MTSLPTAVFCNVTPHSVVTVSQFSVERFYSRDQRRMVGCPKNGVIWVVATAGCETPERKLWHVEGRLSS
jgi:hypothetical protein